MASIKASIRAFEPASRTATEEYIVENNSLSNGVFIVDVTAGASGADTVTFSVQGHDPASGKWYTILEGAAIISNSTNIYRVEDFATASSNQDAADFLPDIFKVVMTKNNATAITYSVGINLSD